MKHKKEVYIIGAGVSGLVCALELEQAGLQPVILDRSLRAGGRVKSDDHQGLPLDHGFQVLLTAYPAARRYLDYEALDLKYFLPGSMILSSGKSYLIGDPLRRFSLLLPTLFAPVGKLSDKLRILRLSNELKRLTAEEIFEEPESSTLDYLKRFGFSDQIIAQFFRPFFSGIFLEPDLATSSRMFRFVYKMFAEGKAAIPSGGMEAIPQQLAERLDRTTFRFEHTVSQVKNREILLSGGETIPAEAIVIATDPAPLLPGYDQNSSWHSCVNLYFEADRSTLGKPLIALVSDAGRLINNLHFVTDLMPAPGKGDVLSVTVVGTPFDGEDQAFARVREELQQVFPSLSVKPLACYFIDRALPVKRHMQYRPRRADIVWDRGIYLAGDQLANPSLNAAMESGRQAAMAVLEDL